jgi:hypothetical protein
MVQVRKICRLDSLSRSDCSGWDSPKKRICDLAFKNKERQKKQVLSLRREKLAGTFNYVVCVPV